MGSGDKNTSRVRYCVPVLANSRLELRRTKKKNIWETLQYERPRRGKSSKKRDQYELRVATQHLLHCFQVPEVWLCTRKTVPTRGAVQHIKGDGEECERIQGGSQRVD